jgi:integrase
MRKDWALSMVQKMDAREALGLLEGSGLTLVDAAKRAVATMARVERSVSVDVAVAGFLSAARVKKLRASTLDWYARELVHFADAMGEAGLDTVTRVKVRQYVEARVPGVRAGVFRCVRALFRWASRQEPPLIATDPTMGIVYEPPKRQTDVQVLSVEQCRRLLEGMGRYRAAVAVALFSGVRPEEIAGRDKPALNWAHVREKEEVLRVPGDIAKVAGVPRTLEGLPDALWRWLKVCPEKREGPVCPARFREIGRRGREVLGLPVWPKDITRDTFASYAVAFMGDAAKVALWLGHEGDQRLLHRHYRGVVSEAAAKEFFGLRPRRARGEGR